MRAVVTAEGGVEVVEVAEPRLLDAHEALVRVEATAICGTDLHAVAGHLPGVAEGTRLGHEYVGVVSEVGSAVTALQVGDRVVGSDFTSCGHCRACRRGGHWHCPHRRFLGTGTAFGPALDGAQAEVVRVPYADTTLGRVPAGLEARLAVLMSDNLATAFSAVEAGGLRPGQTVAVVGGGAVGQLVALAAQLSGAGVVAVSDPVESRRVWARRQGSVAYPPDELAAGLRALTEGEGADLVVEAVGGSRGLVAALAAVRDGGSVVSVSAHTEPSWPLPLAEVFAREVSLRFVIGDAVRQRDTMTACAAAGLLAGAVELATTYRLADAAAAYAAAQKMEAMKVVLMP